MLRIVIVITTVCLMAGAAHAGEIKLKNSFFGGWKYSVDGMDYKKVGFSGDDLRLEMAGNDAAQKEMDKYQTNMTWATVTGIPGGFLLGWPLGGYIASGEWKDSYNTMYMIGVPLGITSIVLEATAHGKLKKAVRIYNGQEPAPNALVPVPDIFASGDGRPRIGLSWRF